MQVSERLDRHLVEWLGAWPPTHSEVTVVGSRRRLLPGWDGSIRRVAGVSTPAGAVLSVPPDSVEAVAALGSNLTTISEGIGEVLGTPQGHMFTGIFRWSDAPAANRDRGVWLPTTDHRLPVWLRPFNGDVLVGFDGEEVAAGVGRKIHNEWGHEVAVVTEEGHRGRGWAADLVAQAAHRILADGAVPIYLHSPDNEASARTADAAGFPDRGWRILGFSNRRP
jgi:GNAT superfamily N-acetyltransferase